MVIFVFLEPKKDEEGRRRWCDIQKERGAGGGREGQKFDEAKNNKIHMKKR